MQPDKPNEVAEVLLDKESNVDIAQPVLVPTEIVRAEDLQVHVDLINSSDDSCSESEFVEDTQIEGEPFSDSQIDKVSVRIQKDIEFLNQSWANLAEHDQVDLERSNAGKS